MNKNRIISYIIISMITTTTLGFFPTALADEVIAEQTESFGHYIIPEKYTCIAQSVNFGSNVEKLTKVEIRFVYPPAKEDHPAARDWIYVGISYDLTNDVEEWEEVEYRWAYKCDGWETFDFSDIDVSTDTECYIMVHYHEIGDNDGNIGLNVDNGNSYPNGLVNTYSSSEGWQTQSEADICFKLYGEYGDDTNEDYNALLIGVGDYPGEENDLPLPAKDVSAMKSALLSGSNWDEDNIKTLVNSEATLTNVKDSLENWLADREDEDDVSLIYYTGHGTTLIDNNGDEEDEIDECLVLFDQFFVDDDFKDILDNSFEGRIVIIIDSCFSGGMPRASGQEENKCDYWNKEFTNSLSGPNRAILMASQEDEESLGITFGDGNNGFSHGFLTMGVLSGLHGSADEDDNDDITVEECFDYSTKMIRSSQEIIYHNILQHPTTHYDSDDLKNIKIVKDNTNSPPNKPERPSGPSSGLEPQEEYKFTSCITDPENGELEVLFYWDDGTFSIEKRIDSGEECSFYHTWFAVYDYNIRLIAIDEEGAISEWSDPLAVSMPKIKHKDNVIENQFMENIFLKYPVLIEMLSLIKNIFSNLFQK